MLRRSNEACRLFLLLSSSEEETTPKFIGGSTSSNSQYKYTVPDDQGDSCSTFSDLEELPLLPELPQLPTTSRTPTMMEQVSAFPRPQIIEQCELGKIRPYLRKALLDISSSSESEEEEIPQSFFFILVMKMGMI